MINFVNKAIACSWNWISVHSDSHSDASSHFLVDTLNFMLTYYHYDLLTGGLDIKAQEAALRLGPDIVIATPGRLIDHLHNSPNFNLSSVEILVLDEADR